MAPVRTKSPGLVLFQTAPPPETSTPPRPLHCGSCVDRPALKFVPLLRTLLFLMLHQCHRIPRKRPQVVVERIAHHVCGCSRSSMPPGHFLGWHLFLQVLSQCTQGLHLLVCPQLHRFAALLEINVPSEWFRQQMMDSSAVAMQLAFESGLCVPTFSRGPEQGPRALRS